MSSKFWNGDKTWGSPDGRYEGGKIWVGDKTWGSPDGRYEGPDSGAAATAWFKLIG